MAVLPSVLNHVFHGCWSCGTFSIVMFFFCYLICSSETFLGGFCKVLMLEVAGLKLLEEGNIFSLTLYAQVCLPNVPLLDPDSELIYLFFPCPG